MRCLPCGAVLALTGRQWGRPPLRRSAMAKLRSRVTLEDVAREAGVSIKTVSRVVNGEGSVKAATSARVSEVADRLGYKPNELARGLKGRRTRTIGLMITDISNPFFADCCKVIEEVATERGYSVILCASSENPRAEREYVGLLASRRVDGLLLVPVAGGHEYLERERAAGLHIVALDRPARGVETDVVMTTNREAVREATEHLVGHGHARIAFVGDDEHIYTARERLEGYREAVREAGLPASFRLGARDIACAERTAHELLRLPSPPTAIVGGNSLITAGVLGALDEAGARIPEDVAVVGFDDFELLSALRPRLTRVRQPTAELGRTAAELLFDRLEERSSQPPQRKILPARLVVRESCGCGKDVP